MMYPNLHHIKPESNWLLLRCHMKASIHGPAPSYTPKPKSCNRCYELRKKCDMIPEGCAKCVKAGLTCSYDRTALSHGPKRSGISTDAVPSATSESVALSKTPCVRCKTHHRRCGKELPACSSCARMTAVTCVYATQPTPGSSLSEAHQTVAKVDRGPLLSRDTPMTSPDAVLKATSAPAADSAEADSVSFVSSSSSEFCDDSSVALSDNIVSLKSYERHAAAVMEANPKLALTDSDLLPTIQDWALCYRFFSGGKYSLLNFMDGVNFLEGFFFQSPPLRLTWCAIAAYMQQPRLSPETCLAYYNRARKIAESRSGLLIIQSRCSRLPFRNGIQCSM
ncbi:hypothetical protein BC830DRAFT_663264 [Chytriomyces sp. MP71]|nr:hypothetical protein BC830DRAFT_663264 [Chytriomyces sp. MP71]